MGNPWKFLDTAWEEWLNSYSQYSVIAARQQARLADLIRFARTYSPLYRELYSQLPPTVRNVRQLPIVTKPDLMAHFDDWVTDRAVIRAGVENFVADKKLIGHLYLGRYVVWTTSGTSGHPGIFVHDSNAMAVYDAIAAVRGYGWATPEHLWTMWSNGRWAILSAMGGHFALADIVERIRKSYPWVSQRIQPFSVLRPLPELVQALNNFQPTVLLGYPTVMRLLAQEQKAGRLKIKPLLVSTAGEWLAPTTRAQIKAAFNCLVRDNYGASEFPFIAFECGHGWLHVNTDWVILEPVDEAHQPVPPGRFSHTVLVTDLANRVQPIIRYDLGDSVTIRPDACSCGSPLPAIRVEGRQDEILFMQTSGGETVPLLPLALATVVEETPGVQRFQVVQTAPAVLSIRFEAVPQVERTHVWENVADRLRAYLTSQGLPSVSLEYASELPTCEPVSGKFRQVWTEWKGV